jgi:hypothetical protein
MAILEGYNSGVLKSASLMVNGEEFNEAVDIIKRCPNLSVGVHLNIIEGQSLTNASALTNKQGLFNKGFIGILLRSRAKGFLEAVEVEFRAQIERARSVCRIDHLDSHVHTHAITPIFKIAVKLANEYKISFIRTQYEKPYIVPCIGKIFTLKYPINIVKIALLNLFTKINLKHIVKPLRSNDSVIGVGYTGMMDFDAIKYGVRAANDGIIEAIIHPNLNSSEHSAVINAALKELFVISNYARLNRENDQQS